MSYPTKIIEQTAVVPATPKEVYKAFLDADEHSEFTGAPATCDPVVGGRFTAYGPYIQGKNLELVAGSKIVQQWQTSEWPEGAPPSIFELRLRPTDEGTEIVMVHSAVPAEQAESYRQGWIDHYWIPLKQYFTESE